MRFAIDLDGVVADYIPPFIRALHELYPAVPADYIPKTWLWWGTFGITKDQWDMFCHEIWNTPNFWLTIPPYHEVVKHLSDYIKDNPKTEFFYITSRPRLVQDSMLLQCKAWLNGNHLYHPNTSIVLVERTKFKPSVYKALGIDKAIDDNLAVIQAANCGWLMLRPWNGYDYMNQPMNLETIATPTEFKEKWLIG